MSRAVLSIGSNLGDRLAWLQSVPDRFGARVEAISAVYRTAPWGGVEQEDFLNAVVVVDDPARSCPDWLRIGHELEDAAGRTREVHWGPRTLDVDVITCGGRLDTPELTLPHPRAHQRAFVLRPWLDVQPAAALEVGGRTRPVVEWYAALPAAERAGVHRTELLLERRR
ncbi:2-amino-4-hydroxy-6-hydroxymethyldihydropteridine diphosphokinase [Skermania piniformis]|uniref:2-amino-4-hydroxy-6-hydroxymethyldihydropteridine diphosphokinase n=1 Tax=Skermania pinensis TaxID=39122 RepID=A0ABX8S8N7_9ACTN|nr:2-amino-4-hydroxy-6-hydroxymethyldihydropteridine diphosphokinase [Skermania piniformis]QXQ13641.1 2-amino-4-hydroxy-6-hydroxymethyldihydropteridine diphosphokinase [Skermania piniformis]